MPDKGDELGAYKHTKMIEEMYKVNVSMRKKNIKLHKLSIISLGTLAISMLISIIIEIWK